MFGNEVTAVYRGNGGKKAFSVLNANKRCNQLFRKNREKAMDIVTIVGLVAATFTTVSLFPQLLKSWRSRLKPSADSMIATYSGLFCIGIFLWLVYGIYKVDLPMIVANTLSFLQGLVILVIQVRKLRLSS